jgi:hypothetical protein
MTGTVLEIRPFVSIPRRVRVLMDATPTVPEGWVHEHQYFPPPMANLELTEAPARYHPGFTREIEQLLITQIHEIVQSSPWDLTSAVVWLQKRTCVAYMHIVRTLCRLADAGDIPQPSTRFYGLSYPTPTRLRARTKRA